MLIDELSDSTLKVLGIVEHIADSLCSIFHSIKHFLALFASNSLNTTDAGSYATLRNNLEHTDTACAACVNTTTELARRSETNYTNLVAILLAEEGDSTELLCLLKWSVTMLVKWNVLTNH